MKINYNSIKVRNIHKSLKFYKQIFNLEINDEYYSDTISVVMLTDGYMKLELIEDKTGEYGLNNIGFVTDNIDKIIKKLEDEDIEIDKQYYETMNFITLKDPDNTILNIIEE